MSASDESSSDSEDDEEAEYFKVLQTLRHIVRLEVEKECVALCESDSDLKSMAYVKENAPFAGVLIGTSESEEEEEKIEHS